MLPAIAASLISGGASLLGSFGSSYLSNSAATRQQNRQNDYNLSMWSLENQYNSPTAQIQRLKEAGLNPNMIYGSQLVSGNSSHSPQMGSFVNDWSNTISPQVLENAFNFASNFNRLKQEKAQLIQTKEQIKNIRENNRAIQLDNKLKQQVFYKNNLDNYLFGLDFKTKLKNFNLYGTSDLRGRSNIELLGNAVSHLSNVVDNRSSSGKNENKGSFFDRVLRTFTGPFIKK